MAEGGELDQENEAVVVEVELIHDTAELVLVGEGEAEGAEDGAKLRQELTHMWIQMLQMEITENWELN